MTFIISVPYLGEVYSVYQYDNVRQLLVAGVLFLQFSPSIEIGSHDITGIVLNVGLENIHNPTQLRRM